MKGNDFRFPLHILEANSWTIIKKSSYFFRVASQVKALDEVLNISPLLNSSYFKKQVMNRNSFVAIDRMNKDGRREKTVRIHCILIWNHQITKSSCKKWEGILPCCDLYTYNVEINCEFRLNLKTKSPWFTNQSISLIQYISSFQSIPDSRMLKAWTLELGHVDSNPCSVACYELLSNVLNIDILIHKIRFITIIQA